MIKIKLSVWNNLEKQENKIKKLKFGNNEYNFDDLPENVKSLLTGLQTVDLQLKMYSDTINLLKISKNSMLNDMKSMLKRDKRISSLLKSVH